MITRVRRTLAALLALAALFAAIPAAAQEPVAIRGTVADSTGTPVQSATVRITRHPQNDGLSTQTGPAGTFTLTFPPGGTEYYVLVSGQGWKPFRARIAPDPANPAWSQLSVRLLAADPVVLAPVTVRAVRAPPAREVAMGPGVGAAEAPVEGVAASLAPAEAGELAAMAATFPGCCAPGKGSRSWGWTLRRTAQR